MMYFYTVQLVKICTVYCILIRYFYMHSFNDPFGFELEKSQLSKLDFPFYLALACILIDRLCSGNVTYLYNFKY